MSKGKQKLPKGPLNGVRVVDLTAVVMGPYSTQIMADMGADVIKIEPPGGDIMRNVSVGPEPGMCGVFVNLNRGKKSVVLDLKTHSGQVALCALIEKADVFIHSMRAKAITKLGFSYSEVAEINPAIVYTNCYGYRRGGPASDRPAYDDTIQAESGIASVQQLVTGEPGYVGSVIADKICGLTAVYATMMALFHRERTGDGQEVEVSMLETMASFMLAEHANGALFDPPLGPAGYSRAVAPNRRPLRTSDGYVSALIYNDKQWNAFVDAVQPEWAKGPEFATVEQRARHIDNVYALLGKIFAQRTTQEWLQLLQSLEIPAAAINSLDDLFDNPQLNAVGFFETIDSPIGSIRFPGVPTGFSQTPGRVAGPAPSLGAHTREVMEALGLTVDTDDQA